MIPAPPKTALTADPIVFRLTVNGRISPAKAEDYLRQADLVRRLNEDEFTKLAPDVLWIDWSNESTWVVVRRLVSWALLESMGQSHTPAAFREYARLIEHSTDPVWTWDSNTAFVPANVGASHFPGRDMRAIFRGTFSERAGELLVRMFKAGVNCNWGGGLMLHGWSVRRNEVEIRYDAEGVEPSVRQLISIWATTCWVADATVEISRSRGSA